MTRPDRTTVRHVAESNAGVYGPTCGVRLRADWVLWLLGRADRCEEYEERCGSENCLGWRSTDDDVFPTVNWITELGCEAKLADLRERCASVAEERESHGLNIMPYAIASAIRKVPLRGEGRHT